jgi:eukaryotic-like serine/threonine-protein kinase
MTLSPGTRLGPYEILAPLGAGGMGEVWRARDTRLDREVAIKVLPEGFAQNEQFRARFEREAKTISSLNHPNICTLHDIGHDGGLHYLVMELIDGESLADRLARGPLPLDQVIRYGGQIADALGRAHRQGIVHRDLKPGNIMITKAGAKLLDFGLARPGSESQPAQGMTEMPTQAKPLTAEGTILGTFQYMAPEQLEGVEADARTDIFALGTVLYEMATGKRAFDGKTKTSLIAAIVAAQPPPISSVLTMSPAMLDRIVKKCLEKDPDDRWQSAYDVASELRWIEDDKASAARETTRSSVGWLGIGFAAALALVVGSLVTWWLVPRGVAPASTRVLQASIEPPPVGGFAFIGDYAGTPVLSPDGTKVVFSAVGEGGESQLWVKDLAVAEPRPIPGTNGAYFPFWSPDSQSIGFFDRINLRRVDLAGAAPRVLAPAAQGKGGAWSKEGVIVFSPNAQEPLYLISDTGGTGKPVTKHDERHTTHRWPHFLEDGKRFIYLAASHLDPFGASSEIRIGSIEEGFEARTLVRSHAEGVVAAGKLLTLSGEDLVAYDFDDTGGTVNPPSRPLGLTVLYDPTTWKGAFTASHHGMLAYVPAGAGGGFDVSWIDRSGVVTPSGLPAGNYMRVEISPKAAVAVFEVQYDQPNSDVWLADLDRGVRTRLTVSTTDQVNPAWSSDGSLIFYGSNRAGDGNASDEAGPRHGAYRVFSRRADGAGGETLIHASDVDEFPWSVSPDGKWVLVAKGNYLERGERELIVVSREAGGPVWKLPGADAGSNDAQFSPDGRWVAFCAAPTGREEVYVVPFNPSDAGATNLATGRWQVSYSGGRCPRWKKDGTELFYVRGDNTLMAVPVELRSDTVVAGRETALFQTPFREDSVAYDVTRDGDRFLVATLSSTSRKPFALVVGWLQLLGR